MPFINDLISYKSVSVVGLEKNTGKTETLNYILKRLSNYDGVVGVTSIGIDGEGVDQVTQTAKPEIYLPAGTLFTTSEGHYTTKKLTSEILNVSQRRTSLGRLVTARVKIGGKVLLSGPADPVGIKSVLADYELLGERLSRVYGALSRMS